MEDLMLAKKTLLNSASGISIESTRLNTLVKSVQWPNKSKLMSSLTVDTVACTALYESNE